MYGGGSFYTNTLQHLTARIYNNGLFTPADVSVSFYQDDIKIASTILPVVQPAINVGYYVVSIPHTFDQAGTFQLKVVVDDPAAYTECKEDNNEYQGTVRILTPAPDVRVFSEYISPSKINPDVNEPITIFLSYDNAGIGDSDPFKARIMVDDVPLGVDVDIPSVAAGDDGTVEVPVPYNSPTAGIRVIRAILDPDAGLTETTKLNNEATRSLVVGKAPNLFFTDLQSDINCPDDGTNVVITASISNGGDLAATAELIFYYVAEADTIPIDNKTFSLAGRQSITVKTEWTVINKTFDLFAAVRNSDPAEYDVTDNSIQTRFCGGPRYNLFVQTEGQGITRKTPDLNRYEGAQQVTVTATAATGWVFAGWQGDASGADNPLLVNLSTNQTIIAVFNEQLPAPGVTDVERCGPGPVTLEATGAVGAQSYRWYTQATGGDPIPDQTGFAFTISDLSVTTSYYASITSFNNEGPRSEVKAAILSGPQQPVITVDGALNCPDVNSPTVLQAPAGFAGYLWSGGETTQQIQITAAGAFSVQVVDDKGCASASSAIVAVTSEGCRVPPAPGVTDIERCGPGSVTFQATGALSAESYRWYSQATGGAPMPDETGAEFTVSNLTETATYYVSIASASNEGPRSAITATILPGPQQPEISVEGELNCPDENNPTVLQAPAGFAGYLWSGDETTQLIQVTAAGTFSVRVVDERGCASAPSANVVLTAENCGEVIIYNAISPGNGDDLNPFLRILNVERLPDTKENTLRIFNRWGDVVFEARNYDNTTNTFTGLTNNGEKLPSGTYFYILEFNNSRRKSISGYLSIRR